MKKIISLILALSVVFALAIPAFAADPENAKDGDSFTYEEAAGGTTKGDVTAQFEEATEPETDPSKIAKNYLVTVAWEVKSSLKYSAGTTVYTWNTEDTKYEGTSTAKWEGTASVTIEVTNKSNDDIEATASWAAKSPIEAECTFADGGEITVESAAKDVAVADGAEGQPKTGTITAAIDTPTAGTINENNATIGTITVTIAAVPATEVTD